MLEALDARLTVDPPAAKAPEAFIARGELINRREQPLAVNLAPLSSPSLALQIRDATGAPVSLPPPPVPGGESPSVLLKPGDSYQIEFAGFLPQWTAPGQYHVRLRYVYMPANARPDEWTGELISEPATFVLQA
jgi:hypothetical protein